MLRGFLIKKGLRPSGSQEVVLSPLKPSSHQTLINYKKDKLLILLRVELSHSSSLPSSKCVFLKHRECKMENIWFALLGSLKATGFPTSERSPGRQSLLAGGGKDEQGGPEPAGRSQRAPPAQGPRP